MTRQIFYARHIESGAIYPFDSDFMSDNPAFELLYGIPDEIKRRSDDAAASSVIKEQTAMRGRPKPQNNIPVQVEAYDADEVVITSDIHGENTRSTFDKYDDGDLRMVAPEVKNISSSALRRSGEQTQRQPTPPHVPPARYDDNQSRQHPVAPPAPPAPVAAEPAPPPTPPTQLQAPAPAPIANGVTGRAPTQGEVDALASSLPKVPTTAPSSVDKLNSPAALPKMKRSATAG